MHIVVLAGNQWLHLLNKIEMTQPLHELVFAGNQCLCLPKEKRRGQININLNDEELEHWNALWKKLNLVCLYCQYRAENREVFSSIKGYK
jgi:hypothetical protein